MASLFSSPTAQDRLTAAVVELEGQTSAEVVVTVRSASALHREGDYLAGFLTALVVLLLLLYLPWPFALYTFPLEMTAGFVVGAVVSMRLPALRRYLVMRAAKTRAVEQAARAAFHELGVSATTGRTGILVYVSLFERRVKLVGDLAVDRRVLEPGWSEAERGMERALVAGDPEAFAAAMLGLGPELAVRLPRGEDDVNELPDEVQA
ncbi:MAG: hypothetical protein KC933_13785 [Myxococcales bacterium]|nr:hypothetical protein [Myxococcales bacterium]